MPNPNPPIIRRHPALLGSLLLFAGIVAFPAAAPAVRKTALGYRDFALWKSAAGAQITPDGSWVCYTLSPREGDPELVAREVDTEREIRVPRARTWDLSPDGKSVVALVPPAATEVAQAVQEKRPPEQMPRTEMVILSLGSGQIERVPGVRAFRMPETAGSHLAYELEPPPAPAPAVGTGGAPTPGGGGGAPGGTRPGGGRPFPGRPGGGAPGGAGVSPASATPLAPTSRDFLVRPITTGPGIPLGKAQSVEWTRDGRLLAITGFGAQGGLTVWRAADGQRVNVLPGPGRCSSASWSRDGHRLLFLSNAAAAGETEPRTEVTPWIWHDDQPQARRVLSTPLPALPGGSRLSEASSPRFSQDGSRIYLSLTPPGTPARAPGSPDPLKVDIWHFRDPLVQPMQKVRGPLDRRAFTAAINLADGRLVPLAGEDVPTVSPPVRGDYALGSDDRPYRPLITWDTSYADLYLVRIADGQRQRILQKFSGSVSLSPSGRHLLYFDRAKSSWRAMTAADRKDRDLTSRLPSRFLNELWDQPSAPPPYGIAGWTADDRSVLLYDRYDIWEVPLAEGRARCLTAGFGRKHRTVLRYQRLDPEEETVPLSKPLLLSAVAEETGDSGFFRLRPAEATSAPALEMVLMAPRRFGAPTRARSAERFLYTQQRVDMSPDYWVSGPDFRNPRRISDANPQQSRFVWGRAELVPFRSKDGRNLRAVLIRPEDADPNRKAPLLINIYERLSQNLHSYLTPGVGTGPNLIRFVSNGYAVLLPDIAYKIGHPGESAYNCVLPAIDAAVARGGIDPERVGITGHSWGGYQTAYLVARTDRFRAAIAGAPVANMVSAYGGIRWQTGMSRAFQYERTQSRIGAPPWEAQSKFIENSPIFRADRIHTPLLILHNDNDGAVPWYQGIELYTAMRRLDREAYLFNYNEQGHGLTDQAAMRHWTVHLNEFLDHHLLGTAAAEWMQKGVAYAERGTRDINKLFGSPPRGGAAPGEATEGAGGG